MPTLIAWVSLLIPAKLGCLTLVIGLAAMWQRWSRFVRQAAKVDLLTQRMIHHEDTQTVHG